MVEDAPYGIFRCRGDGQLLSANPAFQRMLGYEDAQELLRTNLVAEVFSSGSEFQKLKSLLTDQQEFKDVAVELRRRDGAQITVRCSGRSGENHEGAPRFDVFAEDVTEKRNLETQLQMAGKIEEIGRLSGGIAHDFNNPLG